MATLRTFVVGAALVAFTVVPSKASAMSCATKILTPPPSSDRSRALTPDDLVRLRDMGSEARFTPDPRIVALSPDGRRIAFQLRQADPASNIYCLAMIVLDVRHHELPIVVDEGDRFIRATMDFRASNVFPMGLPAKITPQWSRDGRWIYFLKKSDTFTQVWRADTAGRGSNELTSVAFDVESFAVDDEHGSLIIAGRPGIQKSLANIARESAFGFHFDDRYSPMSDSRPFPAKPIYTETYAFDMSSHALRPATDNEISLLQGSNADPGTQSAPMTSQSGWSAWLQSQGPGVYRATLQVEDRDHKLHACRSRACSGRLYRPSWAIDGKAVRYFRREGISDSVTTLYEWTIGTSEPHRLFSTTDLLYDCQPILNQLLCLKQGSVSPEQIAFIDPRSGTSQTLFDPNPEFKSLTIGHVERLSWANAYGIKTIGDLVYPVGYKAGTRYPLIIVQYDTRGFLRGGTGDEYPIQAFANRGYAVLSFSRPPLYGVVRGATTASEVNHDNLTDFADRRSVQSSLETALRSLIARGIVDPKRIGITGLSDGASTLEFGLVNSQMFAAAASSSCCWDPTLPAVVGPAAAREFLLTGYPKLSDGDAKFWKNIALSLNAKQMKVPLLLQMADHEYMNALSGYAALRENQSPVDLFVFPDEYHVKWQPAHRLAIYKRSIDWFDFWLKNQRSNDPARAADLLYWNQLRRAANAAESPSDQ